MSYNEESDEYLDCINDIKNWEIWCNFKIKNVHNCDDNGADQETKILQSKDIMIDDTNAWYLANVWVADKTEVNDGEAEEIGELICSSSFLVKFCPFCGVELSDVIDNF